MRRFEEFFVYIAALRALLKGNKTNRAKRYIGDSIKNNRTLTVQQTIRVLNKAGDTVGAKQLEVVTNILKPIINKNRNRTDSIDLQELTSTYRTVVMNKKQMRNTIGRALGRV